MTRIFDQGTGQEGLDKLREQIANTEQETRNQLKFAHIPPFAIALVRSTVADAFPISVKRPTGLSKVLGVLPGFIEDVTGANIGQACFPECGVLSDGSIQIKFIPGLTNGHTYRISLIAVGV